MIAMKKRLFIIDFYYKIIVELKLFNVLDINKYPTTKTQETNK